MTKLKPKYYIICFSYSYTCDTKGLHCYQLCNRLLHWNASTICWYLYIIGHSLGVDVSLIYLYTLYFVHIDLLCASKLFGTFVYL